MGSKWDARRDPNYRQSTAFFKDLDDEIMRNENMRMRPHYNEDGLRQLAAAVGLQAVIDYKHATLGRPLKGNHMQNYPKSEVEKECLEFFDSPMFQYLMHDIPGEEVAEAIRKAPMERFRNLAAMTAKEEESA